MATPPTFVAEYESAWNTATSPKTVSATAAAGDVFVVLGGTGNGAVSISTPTGGTGITWTQQETQGTDNTTAACKIFSASPSAQTWTLSVARGATSDWYGFNALRFSGTDGIGAHTSTNNGTGTGAPSLSITTQADNSAILVLVSDWNAVDGATRTWATVNGTTPTAANGYEKTYFRSAANYTVYAAYYPDAGTAGAKTVGVTAPTGQRYVIAAIEVLGTSGTPATFTTNTGDATAEGGSSTLSGAALFGTTAGDAPADGGSSTFTGAALFTTVAGDASAEGGSSTFTGAAVFTTVAGDATAEGGVSTFSAGSGVTFTTLAGDAAADGGSSSLTGAALFTTNAGDAAADGGSSTFTGAALFVTTAGDAAAGGGDSTFIGGSSSTFTTLTGDATAEGGTGAFTASATFTTIAGAATGEGGSSAFTVAAVFATLSADAAATGGSSTFTGAAVFATASGDASASGGVSVFIAGEIAPLPVDGVALTVDAGNRGLALNAEARSLEVST